MPQFERERKEMPRRRQGGGFFLRWAIKSGCSLRPKFFYVTPLPTGHQVYIIINIAIKLLSIIAVLMFLK